MDRKYMNRLLYSRWRVILFKINLKLILHMITKILLLYTKLKGKVPLLRLKIKRNFTNMSICDLGIKNNRINAGTVNIIIENNHPLINLANSLPWEEMSSLVLPDLNKTPKGQPNRGRKLKLRIHLAVYLLQQFYNKTDRQIEYAVKDNAAFQLFCGKNLLENWYCPDHTKIEEFRSRLSADIQKELANLIACNAVKLGFADPTHCDIDSTIQSANISRPYKASILTKIAIAAKKVADYLKEKVLQPIEVTTSGLNFFDLKKIKGIFKEYIFTKKALTASEVKEKLKRLFQAVIEPVATVIKISNSLWDFQKDKLPWNIKATIEKLINVGCEYIKKIGDELYLNQKALNLPLALHVKEVACFVKNKKYTKKLQFGRAYQLSRIHGNFILVGECTSIRMNDKKSLSQLLLEHKQYFPEQSIQSFTSDKGYYSKTNEQQLINDGVKGIGIARPVHIKKAPLHNAEVLEKLSNRHADIEPLIGHIKQGGQLGRSRMKKDASTLASGYTAVLGFNLRQTKHYLTGKHEIQKVA